MSGAHPLLAMEGIDKAFGDVPVLIDVDFALQAGEVHARLGENGAGKSRLMNVLAGIDAADAGAVRVSGELVRIRAPKDAAALGIGMVHQHVRLVPAFTAAEKLLLAAGGRRGIRSLRDAAHQLLAFGRKTGLAVDPAARTDTLSIADRQRVEILKVLALGARILVLDEPTAVLTDPEALRLLEVVRGLAAQGIAVVLITHKLREVSAGADRVSVMRKGRMVLAAHPAAALAAAILVAAGVPAAQLAEELIVQVFCTSDGLAQTLTLAIPLTLAGLSAAMAFRVGFWNIGIEGQVLLGAIAAKAVAVADLGPDTLRLPLMLLAAATAGALWIALPVVLKLRLGVSEVVVTPLLGSIAFLLLQHLLFGALREPSANFPVSPTFDPPERLASFGWGFVHAGLVLALLAVLLTALLARATRPGFDARVVGSGPVAGRAAGLPVTATVAGFAVLSDPLAGLAGGVIVAGTEHRLTQFVGLNTTFSGIVVATLALLDPVGVAIAAVLVAGICVAGGTIKVFYGISEGVVVLIQGIVPLTFLIGRFASTYRVSGLSAGTIE